MQLVREVLDEQVIDRDGRRIGKVDDIVLEVEEGGPPTVAAIEIGPVTLARRIHPTLARWVAATMRWLGVGTGEPVRIPFEKLSRQGVDVRADVDGSQTNAFAWERWLRDHVIGRIPGSGL